MKTAQDGAAMRLCAETACGHCSDREHIRRDAGPIIGKLLLVHQPRLLMSTDAAPRTNSAPASPFPTDDPVLRLIGDTPLISYPGTDRGRVLCKLETENPTRSMKDRIAMGILSEALADGGYDTVVEASSGNTAGAVAFVANRLGADCKLACPDTTSRQKIGYMKAF